MPHTSELFSRNSLIIDETLHQKIKGTKLALIGCGLGSNIAELAVRTGFKKFLLADGDNVELSNLNRQKYTKLDIGQNKALKLAKHLMTINNDIEIDARPHFVTKMEEIDEVVNWADYVINTADFSNGFYSINDSVSNFSKISIVPFNVGYGSVVTVFGNQNKGIVTNILKNNSVDGEHFQELLKKSEGFELPKYFLPVYKEITNVERKIFFTPQIGIAANTTSASVLTLIIKSLRKEEIPYFPKVFHIDLNRV